MEHDEAQQRRAIERTLIEYCVAVDRGDISAVVAVFTPGASVDFGPRTTAIGRDAVARLFSGLRATAAATSHRLSNVLIEMGGPGVADAASYVSAWHELVDPAGEQLLIHGRYVDRLRLIDGVWLIDARRLEVHGADADLPFDRVDRRPN